MTVLLTLDLFTGNDGGIIIRVLDAKPAISQASCWRLPALQFHCRPTGQQLCKIQADFLLLYVRL